MRNCLFAPWRYSTLPALLLNLLFLSSGAFAQNWNPSTDSQGPVTAPAETTGTPVTPLPGGAINIGSGWASSTIPSPSQPQNIPQPAEKLETTTTTYPDGSRTTTDSYSDGSTTVTRSDPDGTTQTTTVRKNPDGSTTVTSTIKYPDGSTYTYTTTTRKDPDGSTTETRTAEYPDGSTTTTTILSNPDGATIYTTTTRKDPDGSTTETRSHLGGPTTTTTTRRNPDGSTTVTHTGPDGRPYTVTTRKNPDGSTTETSTAKYDGGSTLTVSETKYPDGSANVAEIEERADGSTIRTTIEQHADGSTIRTTTYPDGRTTTTTRPGTTEQPKQPQSIPKPERPVLNVKLVTMGGPLENPVIHLDPGPATTPEEFVQPPMIDKPELITGTPPAIPEQKITRQPPIPMVGPVIPATSPEIREQLLSEVSIPVDNREQTIVGIPPGQDAKEAAKALGGTILATGPQGAIISTVGDPKTIEKIVQEIGLKTIFVEKNFCTIMTPLTPFRGHDHKAHELSGRGVHDHEGPDPGPDWGVTPPEIVIRLE